MTAQTPLRTVIVDSDAAARAAIRHALASLPSVTIVGEYADTTEAVHRAGPARPEVIIVEVQVDAAQGDGSSVAAIERLARQLPETAIVATTDNTAAEFVVQIIRAGAMELVRRPVQGRELVAALEKLARFRGRPGHRRRGRVTAVFSARGGLGATTLAVNLAVSLAERTPNKSTLLVEVDTRHSDVVTFLDLSPRYSILDVFDSMDRMDESLLQGLMTKHQSGLSVLPGPARLERGYLGGEQVQAGVDLLRGHFDHIVLDLRHDFDAGTIGALEAADTLLFLTSLNVSALRSGAAALAAFRHLGLDAGKVKVIIMRDGTGEDVTVKHAREVLGVPLYWKTPNEYAPIVASINSGQPVVTVAPRSKFARSVRELADALAGDARPAAPSAARRSVSLLASAWPIKHLSGA